MNWIVVPELTPQRPKVSPLCPLPLHNPKTNILDCNSKLPTMQHCFYCAFVIDDLPSLSPTLHMITAETPHGGIHKCVFYVGVFWSESDDCWSLKPVCLRDSLSWRERSRLCTKEFSSSVNIFMQRSASFASKGEKSTTNTCSFALCVPESKPVCLFAFCRVLGSWRSRKLNNNFWRGKRNVWSVGEWNIIPDYSFKEQWEHTIYILIAEKDKY